MLEINAKENRIFVVFKRLDKDGLCNQFNHLKAVFNCMFNDYELGKILRPSDIKLSHFVKRKLKHVIVVSKLDCHVIFSINKNILTTQMVIYPNFIHLTVTSSTMDIVLNNGSLLNFNRMMELLNQLTILSERVMLDNSMIIYMLTNGKMMGQELKYLEM